MHADERGKIVGYAFVENTIRKLRYGHRPYFMTDGYKVYNEALAQIYACWNKAHYRGRGRPPVWKWGLPDDLDYGQVVKTRKGQKLESVEYIRISGNVPREFLNTSAIERMNLTIRNRMARLKRRCQTFSKDLRMLNLSVDVFRAIYNFCSPHSSLNMKVKCNGGIFRKVTPAMELGLTDEVWTVRRLMRFSYRNNIN
jgi:IS1 family transposase